MGYHRILFQVQFCSAFSFLICPWFWMQPILLGMQMITPFLLSETMFSQRCTKLVKLDTTYFTGYADDNTLFVVRDHVQPALHKVGEKPLSWFSSNQINHNTDKCTFSKPCKERMYTFFFIRKFYKKMSLKNPKASRKCLENVQPHMPELEFLKTLIFPGTV